MAGKVARMECGEFKTLSGFHKAGLPACRSTGNLVLYGGDYRAMNRSSQALLTARDCAKKSSSGGALPADSSQESPI